MERAKRLELIRVLLQTLKVQIDYLSEAPPDAQLTAHGSKREEKSPVEGGPPS